MKFITDENDLEIGELYWMRTHLSVSPYPRIGECDDFNGVHLRINGTGNKIWANENLLTHWKIYGPIEIPEVMKN